MPVSHQNRKTPVTLLAVSIALALQVTAAAHAQEAEATPAQAATEPVDTTLDTISVTGYRASLEKALDIKRGEKGIVDAIVAQDIGKFPDLNLAESLQRIPGVVITRDAGEGRNITVRGLGPQFTRVRLNGLEAMSSVGSSDGQGGANRSRSFDFNVFASDLFSQLIARKTASADVEEGSLGATVDLRTARPLDFDGFTATGNLQGSFNDASKTTSPRFAGLISNSWADGRFGALLSVAYSERNTVEEGSGTVRWAGGTTNGGFNAASPFTPALAANVYSPRFPRYTLMEHDQKRLGVTAALQFKPSPDTTFSLDALYSKIDAVRDERYIEANSLSKSSGTGKKNDIRVMDGVVENGALVYAVMNNVGLRAENRHDEWQTTFKQVSLDGEHRFSDSFRVTGKVGTSKSEHSNPIQATVMMDRYGVNGYSYDFRGNPNLPVFNYGINPTDPAGWNLSVIRLRENYVTNDYNTGQLDFAWIMSPTFTLKGGVQAKNFGFVSRERRRGATETVVPTNTTGGTSATPVPLPGNQIIQARLSGISGAPGTWVVPDFDAVANMYDIFSDSGTFTMLNYTPSDQRVGEKDRGAYLMGEFSTDLGPVPFSGNFGVRYVRTSQSSTGVGTINGTPTVITANREYSDTLPSLNLVAEITPDFLIRFGAAKVMARPPLGNLTPGVTVSVSGSARTVSAGNPVLNPQRAKTYDLGFEWYFNEGAMLGAVLFYKDIGSFIQNTRETRPYNTSGLPNSLLAGTTALPTDDFVFTVPINTPGGSLRGIELNYTQPFTFLPGILRDFGTQLNYTYVDSEMQYMLSSGALAQKDQLTGTSKTGWNASLYYEGKRLSGRVSATNRSAYLIQVPGTEVGFNSDAGGVHRQSGTTVLDASIRYKINGNLEVSLEGSNLTNEAQESWVSNPALQLPLEYSKTGRQYLLGLRYKF
ncbi:TonB-dependent receptor [Pseudoxanthomonas japonensis]|uniref:TonB-dependent receptor n=1 Tax=Pseudoxanthomonas TaxID=83618 RepID=UPI0007811ED9|nr:MULTISPECIES: TonB-dependent receptor [Pseudoxanthomonas]MBL8256344.1 TonB-dependent receptor [Pseudoxanthomonas mexicana]MDR7068169.1 TonB-dependent receptor [Pseudoxanthomonas japonensis]